MMGSTNQQLTEYAAQAKELATTQERRRLARELHDSVTQSLYSLTLLAAGWRRLAAKGQLDSVEDSFAEIEDVAQQALKEMRLLIYELRPPTLENEGLQGALLHCLNAVEKRAGVEARLVMGGTTKRPTGNQFCLTQPAANMACAIWACLNRPQLVPRPPSMKYVTATCDPNNIASAKTTESLGAVLVTTKEVKVLSDDIRLTRIHYWHLY